MRRRLDLYSGYRIDDVPIMIGYKHNTKCYMRSKLSVMPISLERCREILFEDRVGNYDTFDKILKREL